MTRLILLLTELINPKKEISFSPSISQHQSNYHNRTQTSKPANLLTSLKTPHPHSKSADRAGSTSADLVNNNLTQPSISQPTTRRKMVPRHQRA